MKTHLTYKSSNFALLLGGVLLYIVGATALVWKAFYLRDSILGTLAVVFTATAAIALLPLCSRLLSALHDLQTAINSVDFGDNYDFNDN